ncbi:unnamed protein product [Gemmata massiliana]|uniref:Uncharacterized protein n=1 Tax=Gemmata massiliana TaxID=1210884 RepID=A0A6P2D4Z3_9BACT|nr:hypothetical protein [Gemmata massiliana]VTR94490.1 unnamed protein product [Gemmata massiliana]
MWEPAVQHTQAEPPPDVPVPADTGQALVRFPPSRLRRSVGLTTYAVQRGTCQFC